jgi:hypothetical protein
VDDLLRLVLGVREHDLRFLLGRALQVFRDALRRHHRLLQRPLALLVRVELPLHALLLLLQRDVLLHDLLELPSDQLQERLDLAGGETAERRVEALLADVERRDLHDGEGF